MRIEQQVVAVSWIPSEAVRGMPKMPFQMGMAHYDQPLPDSISIGNEDLEVLRDADRFRFANQLRAWIESMKPPARPSPTATAAARSSGGPTSRWAA